MAEPIPILVAEDRPIVAGKIRRDLESHGFGVIGMASTAAAALDLAQSLPILGAVLDIDLNGEPVYPAASVLKARGIPLLFLSGYSRAALPDAWQTTPLLEKPFECDALLRLLREALSGARAAPAAPRIRTPAITAAWDRMRHSRDLVTEQRAWTEQAGRLGDWPRG